VRIANTIHSARGTRSILGYSENNFSAATIDSLTKQPRSREETQSLNENGITAGLMIPLGFLVDWAQAGGNGTGFLEDPVFWALPCNVVGFLWGEVARLGLAAELAIPEVATLLGSICCAQRPHCLSPTSMTNVNRVAPSKHVNLISRCLLSGT